MSLHRVLEREVKEVTGLHLISLAKDLDMWISAIREKSPGVMVWLKGSEVLSCMTCIKHICASKSIYSQLNQKV
jgi:hypothetical protein